MSTLTTEQAFQKIVGILKQIQAYITADADLAWTNYQNCEDLMTELNYYITEAEQANYDILQTLHLKFAPTGPFQELSISNGWGEEFLQLAAEFDEAYDVLVNGN